MDGFQNFFHRNVLLSTVFQVCINNDDISKNMAARGRSQFSIYGIYRKTFRFHQTTSSLKQLVGKWPNLACMVLRWSSTKIIQMVQVHWISRSRELKIDFKNGNFKNLLLKNYRAKSFNILYFVSSNGPLPRLFKLLPRAINGAALGAYKFYIALYKKIT